MSAPQAELPGAQTAGGWVARDERPREWLPPPAGAAAIVLFRRDYWPGRKEGSDIIRVALSLSRHALIVSLALIE